MRTTEAIWPPPRTAASAWASVAPTTPPLAVSRDRPHHARQRATSAHRCGRVGKCRAYNTSTGGVMCPSYLATRDEKDSTRGRARVLQELANGSLIKGYRAPELMDVLDLCLFCKGC